MEEEWMDSKIPILGFRKGWIVVFGFVIILWIVIYGLAYVVRGVT